jgi:hypothetical protein
MPLRLPIGTVMPVCAPMRGPMTPRAKNGANGPAHESRKGFVSAVAARRFLAAGHPPVEIGPDGLAVVPEVPEVPGDRTDRPAPRV